MLRTVTAKLERCLMNWATPAVGTKITNCTISYALHFSMNISDLVRLLSTTSTPPIKRSLLRKRRTGITMERRTKRVLKGHHLAEDSAR